MIKGMDKVLALTFILLIQPVFGFLVWLGISKLFHNMNWLDLDTRKIIVVLISVCLYTIFCFMFARGFLSSSEARKLGF